MRLFLILIFTSTAFAKGVEAPLGERTDYLAVGFGPSIASARAPKSEFTAREGDYLSLHWDHHRQTYGAPSPLPGAGTIPVAVPDELNFMLELAYWNTHGDSHYHNKSPSGNLFVGHFDYRAHFVSLSPGLRVHFSNRGHVHPFLDAAGSIGWAGLYFSGDAKPMLETVGSDYRLHDDLFAFGYFASLGAEWDITRVIGVSLAYRYSHLQTFNSALLENHLGVASSALVSSFYVAF